MEGKLGWLSMETCQPESIFLGLHRGGNQRSVWSYAALILRLRRQQAEPSRDAVVTRALGGHKDSPGTTQGGRLAVLGGKGSCLYLERQITQNRLQISPHGTTAEFRWQGLESVTPCSPRLSSFKAVSPGLPSVSFSQAQHAQSLKLI